MHVGSLFTGIGGFDLGLERAGMRVSWQCELDDYCRRVLAKHWPSVPCYGDIRELRGSDLEPVDVLCGGFPCQDISSAGKGAGLAGARSGLWAEFHRLIGELRPRYVIVENVAMLRSRGLGRILGEMAALGYDAEWDCIPACAVGAPHRRDRVWVVGYPDGARLEGHRRSISGACQGAAAATGVLGRAPSRTGNWSSEPDVGRMVAWVPHRVDRTRAIGSSLVPQIAEHIGRRIIEWELTCFES